MVWTLLMFCKHFARRIRINCVLQVANARDVWCYWDLLFAPVRAGDPLRRRGCDAVRAVFYNELRIAPVALCDADRGTAQPEGEPREDDDDYV